MSDDLRGTSHPFGEAVLVTLGAFVGPASVLLGLALLVDFLTTSRLGSPGIVLALAAIAVGVATLIPTCKRLNARSSR
jgi:hypothetical protein